MRKLILLLFIIQFGIVDISYAQNDCEIYSRQGDTTRYKACLKSFEALEFYQFNKQYQVISDEAIQMDSTYALPYRRKSVAYLKSGDFINWKILIDKAVLYDTIENLGYRASCRYQFFKDYKGCIQDIETLDEMIEGDLGEIHNGDYHLKTILAISYDALGNTVKAMEILDEHINTPNYNPLIYDYIIHGQLNHKLGHYDEALLDFEQQHEVGDLAENLYYKALTQNALGLKEESLVSLQLSKTLHLEGVRMNDPYTEPYLAVYLSQIESEIKRQAANNEN